MQATCKFCEAGVKVVKKSWTGISNHGSWTGIPNLTPRKFCLCRGHKTLPTLWEFELLVSSVSSISLEAFVPAFLCPTSDSS